MTAVIGGDSGTNNRETGDNNQRRETSGRLSARAVHRIKRASAQDDVRESVLRFDSFSVSDLSLIDSERKSTIRIGAGPSLKNYGSAFLAIIRQRNQ
jgi:hypothetical protein